MAYQVIMKGAMDKDVRFDEECNEELASKET